MILPNTHQQRGFTLIELVIVMILLIVTGTLIVGILNSTLRGSSKTRSTSDIAQNGNYALSLMSNLILNSQKLVSFTPSGGPSVSDCTASPAPGKTLTILGLDDGATTLTCDDVNATISSTSALFSNAIPAPTPFSTSSLLDTSQVKTVANSCLFTCIQQDQFSPPRIDITFQLTNKNAVAGETSPVTSFNTSIAVRNHSYK